MAPSLQVLCPFHQVFKQLSDMLPGVFIGQISLRIETLLSVGDHHFRRVERVHVQKDEDRADDTELEPSPSCPRKPPSLRPACRPRRYRHRGAKPNRWRSSALRGWSSYIQASPAGWRQRREFWPLIVPPWPADWLLHPD